MRKNNYVIVSFVTNDHYAKYGKRFERDMNRLDLDYDLEYIDPIKPDVLNDRLLNYQRQKKDTCRIRGRFLYRKLKEYQRPILYMDADDKLIDYPVIPTDNYDVGFVRNEHSSRMSIHVAIFLLNPTPNAFHFLEVWDYLNAWPELEPIGDSHIRFIHAKNICFRETGKWNVCNFQQKDLSNYILPVWKYNGNK